RAHRRGRRVGPHQRGGAGHRDGRGPARHLAHDPPAPDAARGADGGRGGGARRGDPPRQPVTPARLIDLGSADYAATRQLQLELVPPRRGGAAPDTLILVEHPHVIPLGRARAAQSNVIAAGDVPVVEIERGGDATYHGPGQLVAYPILALGEGERDLHRFLRNLEEGIIGTLAALGIDGARKPGATGVWVGERKVASIGISCRRWVTF